jgi:hypothetical protein
MTCDCDTLSSQTFSRVLRTQNYSLFLVSHISSFPIDHLSNYLSMSDGTAFTVDDLKSRIKITGWKYNGEK